MYEYNICKKASKKSFNEICDKITENVKNVKLEEDLTDVDGTQIRTYRVDQKKIMVYNDYEVDAVYIDSELELNI